MIRSRSFASDTQEQDQAGPDLTAMLDVLFMLLVFFLLTASAAPRLLPLALPEAETEASSATAKDTDITVSLRYERHRPWHVDEAAFAQWSEAQEALLRAHQARPDAQVLIASDRSVPMEKLVQVLAFLQRHDLPMTQLVLAPVKSLKE